MVTPDEELVQRISTELQKMGLALPEEIKKLSEKTLSGKVKPEDWYALFENSLGKQAAGGADGS